MNSDTVWLAERMRPRLSVRIRAAVAKCARFRAWGGEKQDFQLRMSEVYLESRRLSFQVFRNFRRVTFDL